MPLTPPPVSRRGHVRCVVAGLRGSGGGGCSGGDPVSEVLTAAITVVLGFIVFVLGQIAQTFFIEPIQEQRRVIGEIAYVVLYYGNVGALATPELQQEALQTLRKLSGQLRATLWTVPLYRLFERRGLAEKRENIITASTHLIGWSNSVGMGDGPAASRHRSAVIKALNIPEA